MRVSVVFAAAVLSLLSVAPPASADELRSLRHDMTERTHEIAVQVGRGNAKLVVRRTVFNPGSTADQATFLIDLPDAAVATRLRSSGLDARGRLVWFEGELLDAEVAAARYEELTGLGGAYPKDPALLSWRRRGLLELQVFPVSAHAEKTIEYELELPMSYAAGAYHLTVPALGTEQLPASVRVVAANRHDRLQVNGQAATDESVATGEIEIELAPEQTDPLATRLADIDIAPGRRIVHASFDAAPRLGTVPTDAAIAIVLDTSRSMADRLPAAVAALDAYLSHFPRGTVTLITFDRQVHTPFGENRPVREVLAALQSFRPVAANGSALDAALAKADALLAASVASTRRMVVLSDLDMRAALTPRKLAAQRLESGAVVHVARVSTGAPALSRDDDDAWAKLPRKTGGVLWDAHADHGSAAARAVFEEWARPMRIHNLHVVGLEGYVGDVVDLDEGEALEHFDLVQGASSYVALTGEIWSRRLTRGVVSTPAEERRWSALAFGTSLTDALSDPQLLRLALRGRAVSPMTSYLAIEPGVRPSTEGLDELERGGIGWGAGGAGGGIGLGGIGVLGHQTSFDVAAWIEPRLTAAWKTCGGSAPAEVALETTADEIVEVETVTVPVADAARRDCLNEATWGLELPALTRGHSGRYRVRVGT